MSETPLDEDPGVPVPPATGNAEVDRALTEVADLDDRGLAEHHARLVQAQDVLAAVLESSRGAAHNPVPQALRPRADRG